MELRPHAGAADGVYFRTLLVDGRPVKLTTDWIPLTHLPIFARVRPALHLPIQPSLRQSLDAMETYLKTHLPPHSTYEPLRRDDAILIPLKDYGCCVAYSRDDDFELMPIRDFSVMSRGWNRFKLDASLVSFLPRCEGHVVSLKPKLGVVEYKPQ